MPSAKNFCCYGLFQIYYNVHKGWLAQMGITSGSQLWDPRTNATAALALYHRSNSFAPWKPDRDSGSRSAGRHLYTCQPQALVAQWIEHLTTDQKVRGSSPFERAGQMPKSPGPFGGLLSFSGSALLPETSKSDNLIACLK